MGLFQGAAKKRGTYQGSDFSRHHSSCHHQSRHQRRLLTSSKPAPARRIMNNLVLLAIFFGAITHIASASPTSDPAPGNDLLDIDEVLKKFKDCDENDDGKLSAGECVNQWTGDGSNFNEVDADGDGEVTWKEMKAAAAAIIAEDRVIQSSRARGAYVDLRYVPAPGITAEWLKGKKKGEGDCDQDGDCRG